MLSGEGAPDVPVAQFSGALCSRLSWAERPAVPEGQGARGVHFVPVSRAGLQVREPLSCSLRSGLALRAGLGLREGQGARGSLWGPGHSRAETGHSQGPAKPGPAHMC